MKKRILAYAVIILSVVYFYSSEVHANGDDYVCHVDSAAKKALFFRLRVMASPNFATGISRWLKANTSSTALIAVQ